MEKRVGNKNEISMRDNSNRILCKATILEISNQRFVSFIDDIAFLTELCDSIELLRCNIYHCSTTLKAFFQPFNIGTTVKSLGGGELPVALQGKTPRGEEG